MASPSGIITGSASNTQPASKTRFAAELDHPLIRC
jgi:hypothetical protein